MPNMCNGANLAYRKEVFFEVNGFEGSSAIASGDDEFLMHKIFKKYPNDVYFLKTRRAIIFTRAQKDIKSFLQQRKRWVSKSTKYKNNHAAIVAWVVYLFNISIIVNIFMACFYNVTGAFIFQIMSKLLLEFVFMVMVLNFFQRKGLLLFFIPTQILNVFYVVFIGVYGNIGSYLWKDRII